MFEGVASGDSAPASVGVSPVVRADLTVLP